MINVNLLLSIASSYLHIYVGVTFSLTLEKAIVGDLGKSLWLREIIDSVHREKRPLGHIILVKQNEKPTQ